MEENNFLKGLELSFAELGGLFQFPVRQQTSKCVLGSNTGPGLQGELCEQGPVSAGLGPGRFSPSQIAVGAAGSPGWRASIVAFSFPHK